jgi:sugar lactone lactonase YvrE
MAGVIQHTIPLAACERGRVTVYGVDLPPGGPTGPDVRLADQAARVVSARPSRVTFLVPSGLDGGPTPVRIDGVSGEAPSVEIGALVARGLHQVDNPVVDTAGRVYLTYSGSRGEQVPVSIFRVGPDLTREPFVSDLVNPTAMAFGPDGQLYVSSRSQGVVYRVDDAGHFEPAVSDLGVACGLAFGPDGTLFVGDRSGSIFRVRANGQATLMATLPPSVAAFHLAMGPDRCLYVTAPTLTSRDSIYRVHLDGAVEVAWSGFGRPQGLAFDPDGVLYVVEALAGGCGLFRLAAGSEPELVLSGEGLVGVVFDGPSSVIVASNDSAWRLARTWS